MPSFTIAYKAIDLMIGIITSSLLLSVGAIPLKYHMYIVYVLLVLCNMVIVYYNIEIGISQVYEL